MGGWLSQVRLAIKYNWPLLTLVGPHWLPFTPIVSYWPRITPCLLLNELCWSEMTQVDPERPQMTPVDPKRPLLTPKNPYSLLYVVYWPWKTHMLTPNDPDLPLLTLKNLCWPRKTPVDLTSSPNLTMVKFITSPLTRFAFSWRINKKKFLECVLLTRKSILYDFIIFQHLLNLNS